MASTTGYCLVCGAPTRVVLPESTVPLMRYGGEGAPQLEVPAGSVVLCKEHAHTDVVAFRADQVKAAKAVEKAVSDAKADEEKAAADVERAAKAEEAEKAKAAKKDEKPDPPRGTTSSRGAASSQNIPPISTGTTGRRS